jgi:hypothetical protein
MKIRLYETSPTLITALVSFCVLLSCFGRLECQEAAKAPGSSEPGRNSFAPGSPTGNPAANQLVQQLIDQIERSGGALTNEETPSERLTRQSEIPPGPAPFLSFRTFERDEHYRLGKLDLVVDDAGH